MANRLLADPEADGWERSDFPIVCETCLGPNPYVRMQRMEYGGECHISGRPYTVFRWKPGAEARYKKTIICQEVAKAKNVCQVCLLDLDYNLPVQVRDSALGKELEDLPQSDANKEYVLDRLAADGELDAAFTKQQANDTILRLQRTTPYYKRNRAQICSFFVKGECKRGAECPYRHEMPTSGPLAKQNIKDRYYGVNDPVAEKMLGQLDEMPKLVPPEDTTITTLYVGGLTPDITEQHIKDQFYGHGEIMSVRKVDRKHCAFVTFATREAAEAAAEALSNRLIIQGNRCRLLWGKPMEKRDNQPPTHNAHLMPSQVQMGAPPAFPGQAPPNFFNLPPGMAPPPGLGGPPGSGPGRPLYPSMDTSAMGTKAARQGDAGNGPEAKRQRMDSAGGAQQAAAQPQGQQLPAEQQGPFRPVHASALPPGFPQGVPVFIPVGAPPMMMPPHGGFPPHGLMGPPPAQPWGPPPSRPPGAPQQAPPVNGTVPGPRPPPAAPAVQPVAAAAPAQA